MKIIQRLKHSSDIEKILLAMVFGALMGFIIGKPAEKLSFIGDIWINLMRTFLMPVVIFMLVKSITSLKSADQLKKIGTIIIAFYICTTILASTTGLLVTSFLNVGSGFSYQAANDTSIAITELPSIDTLITGFFPKNLFKTLVEENTTQVIIISIIIGIAILNLPDDKREPVKNWFHMMADLMSSIVRFIIKLAPIGIFFLMASSIGVYGSSMLYTILKILLTFYLVCLIHLLVVYSAPLWLITGIDPLTFIRKSFPVMAVAFSTCSSSAVMPVSMDTAKKNFDVDDSIASLGVTLGATINKDGTAIMCCVVLCFTAQALGLSMSLQQFLNIILITTLITSANAGLPGGGIMNLTIVATAVGMPLDIVMLVAGFYRFFDIGATPMNCLGDLSATIIVDRIEKKHS